MPHPEGSFADGWSILLGVVRLNAERDQALSCALVLIRILGTQRLGERIPQLLEDNDQLLGTYFLFRCFTPDFTEKRGELR
jgi:hypothetical protein